LLSQQSRWVEAEPRLRSAIVLAKAMRLHGLRVSASSLLFRRYRATGRRGRALGCLKETLRAARALGNESVQASALDAAGDLHRGLAQPEQALQSYEQSLDLFRKLDNREWALVAKLDIGALHQACGRWDKAIVWYEACLRDAEATDTAADQAAILYELACLHIHKGEAHKAAQLLLRDMALYRQMRHTKGADRVGRTLLGLGVAMHHRLTADRLTFRDVERGSAANDDDQDGGEKE
jgi:tetratricopeptide (TPR) repeat protein